MNAFDCNDIKAVLSGLVDDELDAPTRHAAERHLAGCAACRALVSEAEGLDDLIAMDAAALAPAKLPDDFVDSVLGRTVYARAYEQAGWNVTTWLGWVAAAAALGLAASIWFLDRAAPPRIIVANNGGATAPNKAPPITLAARDPNPLVSWTFDDALPPEALSVRPASNVTYAPVERDFTIDEATGQAIDERLALAQPTRSALSNLSQRPTLSDDDQLTLRATAALLEMVGETDLTTFSDIEHARAIAVYDELPQRLAELRPRLSPAQRAVVMAAESIILRVVNGPLDLEDLRLLHETVASMSLARQVEGIGSPDPMTSM